MKRKVSIVANVPNDYAFVSDSQEVEAIKFYLGKRAKPYDAFLVQQKKKKNGEYTSVYGMVGTVPYKSKLVRKLI